MANEFDLEGRSLRISAGHPRTPLFPCPHLLSQMSEGSCNWGCPRQWFAQPLLQWFQGLSNGPGSGRTLPREGLREEMSQTGFDGLSE